MKKEYMKPNTTVSFVFYHFVFCPRYRRKIFLDKDIEKRFKELIKIISEEINVEIVDMITKDDYVHLSLRASPDLSPAQLMAKFKGKTSRQLREEFPALQHLESIWTRSFFVSTAPNIPIETIRQYVESQKKRG